MRSNLKEIEVQFVHETDKAILVWGEKVPGLDIWIPKSQCEIECKSGTPARGQIVTLIAEEALLIEKGLV